MQGLSLLRFCYLSISSCTNHYCHFTSHFIFSLTRSVATIHIQRSGNIRLKGIMQNEPPCDPNAQEGQGAGMLLRLLQAGMNGRKKFQYSLLKFYEGVMHAEPNVVDSTHIFQQTPIQISRKVHGPFREVSTAPAHDQMRHTIRCGARCASNL